jgi:hypothetical protein
MLWGCDFASAIFGMGKGTVFNRIIDNPTLHADCRILQWENHKLMLSAWQAFALLLVRTGQKKISSLRPILTKRCAISALAVGLLLNF